MKLLLLSLLFALPLYAQKKANSKHLAPFQWNNQLPKQYEELGVQHHTYESKLNRAQVGYHILLPEQYHEQPMKRFPVVYLLHGGRPGNENKILNLVAFIQQAHQRKVIPPTIYVFVNGGPVSHYDYPTSLDHSPAGEGTKGNSTFIKELIPHIDQTYRTLAVREGRFLEGYSQGGRGALRAAFRNPEMFQAISAGSAGVATEKKIQQNQGAESPKIQFTPGDDAYTLAQEYSKSKLKEFPLALLLYTGNSKADFNWEGNLAYSDYLKSLDIPHRHLLIPNGTHSAKKSYEISGDKLFGFFAPYLKDALKTK
jgi:enterochelin esterase-like enzyme